MDWAEMLTADNNMNKTNKEWNEYYTTIGEKKSDICVACATNLTEIIDDWNDERKKCIAVIILLNNTINKYDKAFNAKNLLDEDVKDFINLINS